MSRAKGVRFEHDVAALWQTGGFDVYGLDDAAGGDHLLLSRNGLRFSSECKRQERLRIPEWWKQTTDRAPQGTIPMLTFRQSRKEPLTVMRTADLIALLSVTP